MAIPPSGEAAATALGRLRSGRQAREYPLLRDRQAHARACELAPGRSPRRGWAARQRLRSARAARATSRSSPAASALRRCCCCARGWFAPGARVRLFYGARTAELLVDAQRFADAGCEAAPLYRRRHARRTRLHDRRISASRVNPEADSRLRSVADVARGCARSPTALGVRAQLSLEETFGCGVGGCWGCVVPLTRRKRASTQLSAARSAAEATSYTRASAKKARSFGRTSFGGESRSRVSRPSSENSSLPIRP